MKKLVKGAKRSPTDIRSPLRQKILLLLASGIVLGLTPSFNKQLHVYKQLPKEWRKIDRAYLWRVVKEFNNDRLVEWKENKDGIIYVVLTEQGKRIASYFDPNNLNIPKPITWDQKWHLVVYDIPHTRRLARDALRSKLKGLGFKEWQKSVFIYPYPCNDQINFIIEFFDIRPYVRQATITDVTNEAELKLHFKLK